MKQRSVSIVVDNILFETDVKITDDMWQRGLAYNKNNVFRTVAGRDEVFVFRTGIDRDITMEDVEAFENANYETFEDYTNQAFDIHKITFAQGSNDWKEATCTCPSFNDNYMCKHIIGIANRLTAIDADEIPAALVPDYDDMPLFAATRGRPKKATAALDME